MKKYVFSFKPYYKWNTFNTPFSFQKVPTPTVLNLIINGIPSIHVWGDANTNTVTFQVLNLIINVIPSILSSIYFIEH